MRLPWTALPAPRTFASRLRIARILNARLRPSACPFVLFPARRRNDHCAACRACKVGSTTRSRAHRYRQSVWCTRILGQAGERRYPAHRRLRACRRLCRSGGRTTQRQWSLSQAAPHRASGGARRGLPQPVATQFPRVSRHFAGWAAAPQAALAGRRDRGADRTRAEALAGLWMRLSRRARAA